MDQEELFRRLAVALAIGLLIGLERGWQTREESDHQRTAGLRTFALSGLLGGICALLSVASSPIVLGAGLLAFTMALLTFSYLEAVVEKNFSVTGVVAGLLTFTLGAYAMLGNEAVAVGAAVAMAILLALRDRLHNWIRAITWPEIRSVLVLLAMSFLLLPILPNRPVDPWQALNPFEIWLLAILIAAISFAGYIAVRVLGERKGIAVAAIAGGLTSSTATTLSFARLAREYPESSHVLSGGVLLANVTMFLRVVALIGILKPELLGMLLWPISAAVGVSLAATAALQWGRGIAVDKQRALEIRNPFDMAVVLWLAALIAIIILVAKLLAAQANPPAVYLLAALSGIADVDALTLSMTRLAGTEIPARGAAGAILIATAMNTASKAAVAAAVGGRILGAAVGGSGVLVIAAMAIAFLLSA